MGRAGLGVAALILAGAAPAGAQVDMHWAAPLSGEQARQTLYFPMGTPLRLTTTTQMSTKFNKPGDRMYLELAEPLVYNGEVVVPARSIAVGEVMSVQRNGHLGVKGKLAIRLVSLQTPSGPVRIDGSAYDEGRSGTALSVGTVLLVSPLGILIHGTSAALRAGTVVAAQLVEPLRFAPLRQAQALMTPVAPDRAVASAVPASYTTAAR